MANVVLVTGATGLLGREVHRIFTERGWNTVGTGLTRSSPSTLKLDLTNHDEIKRVLDNVKPRAVVHCAANRYPDSCAANPAAAHAINVASTTSLAQECLSRGVFLLYISTDYVFSGRPGEAPYTVDAVPSPPNEYGKQKFDGEKGVDQAISQGANAAILRVPILYGSVPDGDESQSVINAMVPQIYKAGNMTKADEGIKMDHYAQRYPTNTADVGRICHDVTELYISAKSTDRKLPRILHFSSEEKFTKWEMCQLLAEVLGLPLSGMVPDKPDDGLGVQRPYDCHLDTTTLKDLGINLDAISFETWWRHELRAFRH